MPGKLAYFVHTTVLKEYTLPGGPLPSRVPPDSLGQENFWTGTGVGSHYDDVAVFQ